MALPNPLVAGGPFRGSCDQVRAQKAVPGFGQVAQLNPAAQHRFLAVPGEHHLIPGPTPQVGLHQGEGQPLHGAGPGGHRAGSGEQRSPTGGPASGRLTSEQAGQCVLPHATGTGTLGEVANGQLPRQSTNRNCLHTLRAQSVRVAQRDQSARIAGPPPPDRLAGYVQCNVDGRCPGNDTHAPGFSTRRLPEHRVATCTDAPPGSPPKILVWGYRTGRIRAGDRSEGGPGTGYG